MKYMVFPKSRTVRELRKRVPIESKTVPGRVSGYGFTTVPDGREEVYYSTEIDGVALEYMAKRAASNKSGVCRDGALVVRVIERNKIS